MFPFLLHAGKGRGTLITTDYHESGLPSQSLLCVSACDGSQWHAATGWEVFKKFAETCPVAVTHRCVVSPTRSKAVRRRAANLRQLQRGQRTAHPTRLRPRDLRARLPRAFCGWPRDALRSWCSAQHAPGTFQRPGRRAIDILWPTLWRPYHRQGVFLASRRRGLAAQVAYFRPRQGRPQATDYREAYRLQATGYSTKPGAGYSQHPGPSILFVGFASCSSCQSVSERRPKSGGLQAELGFIMAAVRNGSRERFVRAAVAGTTHSSWTPGTKIKNRKIANLLTNIVRPGGLPLLPACRPC